MALDQKKRGNKKKVFLTAGILGAAALAAAGFFLYRRNEQKKAEEAAMLAMSQPVEEMAVRTSIETTFSAQGSVASSQEMTAGGNTADKTGAVVAEVYVKVGDTVHQGDPLYRLDLSSVEADIADQEAKLRLQQQSDAIDQNAAGRAITNAQY
ncbi:MAG: biotin/lipoyl-binding protein, partial [Lachnospiraceae bacterium]|nr:biotin/lipoyl-binding protein [Lachnospiraceae bacterium]